MSQVKSEEQQRAEGIIDSLVGKGKSFTGMVADTMKDLTKDIAMNVAMPGSGMMQISKGAMLKKLGKAAAFRKAQIKAAVDFLPDNVPLKTAPKKLSSNVRGVANEIKSAPDDLYDLLHDLEIKRHGLGSHYSPKNMSIVLDPMSFDKKTLRHETAHYIDDMIGNLGKYDDMTESAKSVESKIDPNIVERLNKKFPHVKRSSSKGRKSYLDNYYGYHPEEDVAVSMEDIPLSGFSDTFC